MVDQARVLTKSTVPHKLKMHSKKLLRKQHGTSDGWRQLIDKTIEETFPNPETTKE